MSRAQISVEQVRALAAQGFTSRQVAAKLNCSQSAIRNYAYRHGVRFSKEGRYWSDEEVARLKLLFNENVTVQYLSEKLGRPTSSVGKKILDLGLRTDPSHESAARVVVRARSAHRDSPARELPLFLRRFDRKLIEALRAVKPSAGQYEALQKLARRYSLTMTQVQQAHHLARKIRGPL